MKNSTRITLAVVSICVALCLARVAHAAERPNILFIMADDHTAQAIGAYATLLKEVNPTHRKSSDRWATMKSLASKWQLTICGPATFVDGYSSALQIEHRQSRLRRFCQDLDDRIQVVEMFFGVFEERRFWSIDFFD